VGDGGVDGLNVGGVGLGWCGERVQNVFGGSLFWLRVLWVVGGWYCVLVWGLHGRVEG